MKRLAAGAYALAALLLLLALGSLGEEPRPPAGPAPLLAGPARPVERAVLEREDSAALVVPSCARAGRPFVLECEGADPRKDASLRVDGSPLPAEPVSGPGPLARVRVTLHEEGWRGIEVARPAGEDLVAWVRVGPPVKVAWVGPDSPVARHLEDAGFLLERSLVPGADLLVLASAAAGPEEVERFAREGGGVLLLGGEALRAFGGEIWSPVEPEPPRDATEGSESEPAPTSAPGGSAPSPERVRTESATVSLILLIDRSGSMAGAKLERAREAALASAETLDPEDRVAVVAFDVTAEEVFPLGKAGEKEEIRRSVATLRAEGGTRFAPALRRATEIARASPPGIRHAILLSDGMTEDWETSDYPRMVREARASGVTLSTVGFFRPGERGDEPLALLARWGGGRFYPVEDPREIPQVFTLEARRVAGSVRPGRERSPASGPVPSAPRVEPAEPPSRPAPPLFTARLVERHDSLEGVDLSSAPPFDAYLPARPRPRAAVPLRVEPTGDPLLALRSVGSGWIAAWCGDGGEGAFSPWVRSGDLLRLGLALSEFLRRGDGAEVTWRLEAYGESGLLEGRAGGAPPGLLRSARSLDAWTRRVDLDPPLRGALGPDGAGRLRSSLRRVAPLPEASPPGPASAPSSRPLDPIPAPARGPGLLFGGAALALAAGEGARRLPSSPQRRPPRPSFRVGESEGGEASRAGSR
ncbi:MAG TPA: VWA domain-containing protein [Planctomycetota bacterium]|jgi:hypothetical protein|nr:VWA domain-containing protein [Planctomycetota bacterium]